MVASEIWDGKSTKSTNLNELAYGGLESNAESNVHDRGWTCEVSEISEYSTMAMCVILWIKKLWFLSAWDEELATINKRPALLK